jgi:hypothetical protein
VYAPFFLIQTDQMGLFEQAQKDAAFITSNSASGFGIQLFLQEPSGQTATINGIHTKHHLGIDTEGNMVNSKKAHVCFSEQVLLLANPLYPVRNSKGEVSMAKHKVTVKDSTGSDKQYVALQWFPDEAIGVITCILGDYE